eukprot:TRINITY_DN4516_c0_g1_i1.p1 TRINITY_DN4516_c0_g1~~TRINITY_DN4516_c0_g1_i1.p1  ORF type:complete len:155 (+),score=11.05 TRINITY_DN4516_c0_g1_i1:232-696(+)
MCWLNSIKSNKIKELLAQVPQNMVRWNDKNRDPEADKLERATRYPGHMHISLELLDAVHLISAMFMEVLNVAIHGLDKKFIISKLFRRLMDNHKRYAFNIPSEDTRDSVLAAVKELQRGDWKKAYKYIERLKVWRIMPNKPRILTMIKKKIPRT